MILFMLKYLQEEKLENNQLVLDGKEELYNSLILISLSQQHITVFNIITNQLILG